VHAIPSISRLTAILETNYFIKCFNYSKEENMCNFMACNVKIVKHNINTYNIITRKSNNRKKFCKEARQIIAPTFF